MSRLPSGPSQKAERGHEAIRGIVDEVHRSVVFAGVADDPSPDDGDDLTGESLVTGSGDRVSAVECGLADIDHVFADELEDNVWDSRIASPCRRRRCRSLTYPS